MPERPEFFFGRAGLDGYGSKWIMFEVYWYVYEIVEDIACKSV